MSKIHVVTSIDLASKEIVEIRSYRSLDEAKQFFLQEFVDELDYLQQEEIDYDIVDTSPNLFRIEWGDTGIQIELNTCDLYETD